MLPKEVIEEFESGIKKALKILTEQGCTIIYSDGGTFQEYYILKVNKHFKITVTGFLGEVIIKADLPFAGAFKPTTKHIANFRFLTENSMKEVLGKTRGLIWQMPFEKNPNGESEKEMISLKKHHYKYKL